MRVKTKLLVTAFLSALLVFGGAPALADEEVDEPNEEVQVVVDAPEDEQNEAVEILPEDEPQLLEEQDEASDVTDAASEVEDTPEEEEPAEPAEVVTLEDPVPDSDAVETAPWIEAPAEGEADPDSDPDATADPEISDEDDEGLLFLESISSASLPDMPHQGCIWPLDSEDAIAYLTYDGSASEFLLRKLNYSTNSISTLATFSGFRPAASYFAGDKLYYTSSTNSYFYTLNSDFSVYCLDLRTGEETTVLSISDGDLCMGIGVDSKGRIYLDFSSSFRIYSKSGTLLYSGTRLNSDGFIGFDASNGNFYFQGTTNWIYWGYDHTMACLKVGNFNGSTVNFNDKSITIFYQSYWYTHYGCAQLMGGRYLADLSTFSGDQLAVLDSRAIKYSDVTDTETTIDMTSGGVSVTSVCLPAKTVVFGCTTVGSEYDDDEDISSVGPRCAYDSAQDLLAVATDTRTISFYNLHEGKIRGTAQTSAPIYYLAQHGDELLVLERDGSGGLLVERFSTKQATKLTISGPKTVKIGGSADYTVTANADILPDLTFESSDPTVLSIDSKGRAAAWKAGTVTVTARSSTGLSVKMTVTVSGGGVTKTRKDVTPLSGTAVYNVNGNNYQSYGNVVDSYLVETPNGLMRVQARDNDVLIEYFNKAGKRVSTKTIKNELPIFGGFYAGSDSYYLVFGRENPKESDSTAVLRVVKYDTSWKKVRSCDVKGANTTVPFDAGSLRMTETAGKLYIHTCHEMYQSEDGYNHQANMTFVIKESNMTLVDSYYDVMNLSTGYVSHSFNQFIATDGTNIYRIDHGDMYPRGIVFTSTPVGGSVGSTAKNGTLTGFEYEGYGNYTGASIGGLVVTDAGLVVAYNEDATGSFECRNIKLVSYVFEGDTKVVKVTSYKSDSDVTCYTPHLVRIDGRHLLLMWAEYDRSIGSYRMKVVQVDHSGQVIGKPVSKVLPLSSCVPIALSDGSVAWYASSNNKTTLYTLNPYDLSSMSNDNFDGLMLANVSGASITVKDQAYTGSAVTPAPTVTMNGRTLKAGTDYTVSYKSNVMPGTATVTIKGKGSYAGTNSVTFRVKEPFRDVNAKTPHYEDILWLYASGVTKGWELANGIREFRPYGDVARCDMAAFLYRMAGSPSFTPTAAQKRYFSDVNSSTPHCNEIWWLAAQGISTGWTESDGTHTFRPYENVARCDMAAFLYRLAGSPSYTPTSAQRRYFSDIDSSSPHASEVWWLASTGVSVGWTESDGSHTFRPYSNVARCDMAAFLHRMANNKLVKKYR